MKNKLANPEPEKVPSIDLTSMSDHERRVLAAQRAEPEEELSAEQREVVDALRGIAIQNYDFSRDVAKLVGSKAAELMFEGVPIREAVAHVVPIAREAAGLPLEPDRTPAQVELDKELDWLQSMTPRRL